jgi:hypothetical protein
MLFGFANLGEAGAHTCESGSLCLDSSGGRPPQVSKQRFDAWVDVTQEVFDCAKTSELGRTSARKGSPRSEAGDPSRGEAACL